MSDTSIRIVIYKRFSVLFSNGGRLIAAADS